MDLERTKYLRVLRRLLSQSFDMGELQVLTYDLGIDWDDLSGDNKSVKTQSLITYLARRGQLEDLLVLVREERPKVEWPDIPAPEQQIEDGEATGPIVKVNIACRDMINGDIDMKVDRGQASVTGDAIGNKAKVAKNVGGSVLQAETIKLGQDKRDEQYAIALNSIRPHTVEE